MKKLFAIVSLGFVMTACNNNSEKAADVSADSLNTESPLMDAVNTADSAGKVIEAAKDSLIKAGEEIKEAVQH
ncbi:MAG: hypothetical protein WBP16_07460 [Ferruginibacter sp.]